MKIIVAIALSSLFAAACGDSFTAPSATTSRCVSGHCTDGSTVSILD